MAIPKLSKSTWAVIAALPVIIGIITGILKMDDRYAKAADIKETEILLAEGLEQTTQTIKNNYMISELGRLNGEIESYSMQRDILERELERDPNNPKIKRDLEEVNKKINARIKKRDTILDKLAKADN